MSYSQTQWTSSSTTLLAALGVLALNAQGCGSEGEGDPVSAQAGATGSETAPGATVLTSDGMASASPGPGGSAPVGPVSGAAAPGSTATGLTVPQAGSDPVAGGSTAGSPGAVTSGGAGDASSGGTGVGDGPGGINGLGASGGLGGTGETGAGGGFAGSGVLGEAGGMQTGAAGTVVSSDGGAAGSSAGGAGEGGGAGGAPVEVGSFDDVMPSAGCGQDPPASDRYSIDVGGLMRDYILAVPEGYDPEKPYRLIFGWHPWGGSAQQVAGNGPSGYYGLMGASAGEAILVSPEGLDFGGNGLGWGNEGGQDIDFLRAMIERFDSELCFDHNRMFSTGFSFGGMMSNAVACAGLARAVAPMAGNSMVAGCEDGARPVAYMGFHGDADSVVSISGGEAARDVFVERNGCGAATPSDSNWCELAGANFQPCTCTTYEGCQVGYPVTWCQFSGDHMVAPNSGETIWDFFVQF